MARLSAINPLSYVIDRQYSGSDVIRNKLFSERLSHARNLYRKDLFAHYGCVNAIEFSPEGELLVSGGDDRRVLLWSIPGAMHGKCEPVAMNANHTSNIFCLSFDSNNSRIFSGGNDDQVFVHDVKTGKLVYKLPHRKPVYGLNLSPRNDDILATAGDDGRVLLYDLRENPIEDVKCLAKYKTGFHSVMFNPNNPQFVTTANAEEGIALWDCRKPKEVFMHYDAKAGHISGISACFNSDGSRILALRRRLPPVMYATYKEGAICQFYHPQYYNSCTMKTCCFAGENDQYVLSGSDDFNLYMWKIIGDESEWGMSHLVLRDHRSIVNQVRYNKRNNLIASSGVEKMIKLWSPLHIGNWKGSLLKERSENSRFVYTHRDYLDLVGRDGERISHDYSDHSTVEDPKMIAFFDSLIQREIEGWKSSTEGPASSDSDSDSQEHEQDQELKPELDSRPTYEELTGIIYPNARGLCDDFKKHRPNRIAELIADKRGVLARMAHRTSPSAIAIRQAKLKKHRKRKCSSYKKKISKPSKNNGTMKKSPTKNSATDRDRRKQQLIPDRTQLWKYRTRQSLRELCDNNNTSSNSIDVPSTSTGITSSSNTAFRVIEQDSEEDVPTVENNNVVEDNFVNILPTPLNGTHDMYIKVLEVSNGSSNSNVVTVRNEDNYSASTSNGNNNNTCDSFSYNNSLNNNGNLNTSENGTSDDNNSRSVIQLASYSVDSYVDTNSVHDTDTDSDYGQEYVTPVKKRRTESSSDSGCATGPCSSSSPYPMKIARHLQASSSKDSYSEKHYRPEVDCEKFQARLKKLRAKQKFIRKQINESDSNN